MLDHYVETFGQMLLRELVASPDLKQALAALLCDLARVLTTEGHSKGCMILLGMPIHAPDQADIAQGVANRRVATRKLFPDRPEADRDPLPQSTDLTAMANSLVTAAWP